MWVSIQGEKVFEGGMVTLNCFKVKSFSSIELGNSHLNHKEQQINTFFQFYGHTKQRVVVSYSFIPSSHSFNKWGSSDTTY